MRCKCKVLSVNGIPASDGSIVPLEVMNSYINSQECKDALRDHKMIGSLTHRSRSIQSNFSPETSGNLSKTVGKDDSLIIVSDKAPAPTHYIDALYIEEGWLWAEIKILEETGMDDIAIQNIRRLKGMISQGILPGVSAVIVGYWNNNSGTGSDVLSKMVNLKGIDITLNPSWKAAGITEVLEDDKNFSEIEDYNPKDYKFSGIKVKTFSNVAELGIDCPKTSKIDGQFTKLLAKVFSSDGSVSEISDCNSSQKTFSAMSVNERVKFAKFTPRERFRRMIIDYRQALKSHGGIQKIDSETLKVMKSLFASDVLNIMGVVTPQVLQGKNVVTLLNAGAMGPEVRKACQALQMPYRMALQENKKIGYISKMRYQKIQESYTEFISALQNYVFGTAPLEIDEETNEEED